MDINLTLSQIFQPLLGIKIIFMVISFSYIIFAFVVLNQINTMNKVINEIHLAKILQLIGIINLIGAIFLFLTTAVIL